VFPLPPELTTRGGQRLLDCQELVASHLARRHGRPAQLCVCGGQLCVLGGKTSRERRAMLVGLVSPHPRVPSWVVVRPFVAPWPPPCLQTCVLAVALILACLADDMGSRSALFCVNRNVKVFVSIETSKSLCQSKRQSLCVNRNAKV